MLILLSHRSSEIVEKVTLFLILDDYERNKQKEYFDNNIYFRIFQGFTRSGYGYMFQNLAFLVNIYRWKAILAGRSTANLKSSKISHNRNTAEYNEEL